MLIDELKRRHPGQFHGDFRVVLVEYAVTKGGKPYGAIRLGDMSGILQGYLWSHRNAPPPVLRKRECVSVDGRLREFNDRVIADLESVVPLITTIDDPVKLIPVSECPVARALRGLDAIIKSLRIEPLSLFLRSVFSDDEIALAFVKVPASKAEHHSFRGGLLVHSVECAEIVAGISKFPEPLRELGVVAALLHDIGKTMTMNSSGGRTKIGYVVHHDDLSLEILSRHLRVLDNCWADGGSALRYILTWKRGGHHQHVPLMTIVEAVQFADRCSSGIWMENELFGRSPKWRQFANGPGGNRYWRPHYPS